MFVSFTAVDAVVPSFKGYKAFSYLYFLRTVNVTKFGVVAMVIKDADTITNNGLINVCADSVSEVVPTVGR